MLSSCSSSTRTGPYSFSRTTHGMRTPSTVIHFTHPFASVELSRGFVDLRCIVSTLNSLQHLRHAPVLTTSSPFYIGNSSNSNRDVGLDAEMHIFWSAVCSFVQNLACIVSQSFLALLSSVLFSDYTLGLHAFRTKGADSGRRRLNPRAFGVRHLSPLAPRPLTLAYTP